MAESKRIFNAGKMNRDLDDRIVPQGEYRDALNVGIGRSEGSDVGAVENLKGNEILSGQDNIQGQTIGSIKDQSNDSIYWFTTSPQLDAIHEYSDGTVKTLISEPKARPAKLPTCVPELQSRITEPIGTTGGRGPLPALPDPPVIPDPFSVSISGGGTSFDHDASITLTANPVGTAGTLSYQWQRDGTTISGATSATLSGITDPGGTYKVIVTDQVSSMYSRSADATAVVGFAAAPQPVAPVASISGPDSGDTTTNHTFSGAGSSGGNDGAGTNYTVTDYTWTATGLTIVSGQGTDTLVVSASGAADGNYTISLVVTNSNGDISAQDDHVFEVAAAGFTFTVTVDNSAIANTDVTGGITIMGIIGVASTVSDTSGIAPSATFEWTGGNPPAGLTATITGDTTGLTLTQSGATATLSGSVSAAGAVSIVWSGASVQEQRFTHTRIVNRPSGVVGVSHSLTGATSDFTNINSTLTTTQTASTTILWNNNFQTNMGQHFSGGHPTLTVDGVNHRGTLSNITTSLTGFDTIDTQNELWRADAQIETYSQDTTRTADWAGTIVNRVTQPPYAIAIAGGTNAWMIGNADGVGIGPYVHDAVAGDTCMIRVIDPNNIGWSNLSVLHVFGWSFTLSQTSGTGTTDVTITVDAVGTYASSFATQYGTPVRLNFNTINDTTGGTGSVLSSTSSFSFLHP